MTGIITRLYRGAVGTFSALAWGTEGGSSIALMKLAHDVDKVVDKAAPLPVTTPGGLASVAATPFARPADVTPYAAGDLVANSTVAGTVSGLVFPNAVREPGEAIRIERLRLRKDSPNLIGAAFRVYICRSLPGLTVGDNATFNALSVLAVQDVADVVGWFDVVMDRAGATGARGVGLPNAGGAITVIPKEGASLFALIEAVTAYTPTSGEVFNATIEGQRS